MGKLTIHFHLAVLDLDRSSKVNGTKVQGWPWGGTDNQKWKIEPLETRHDVSGDLSAIVITRSGWMYVESPLESVVAAC